MPTDLSSSNCRLLSFGLYVQQKVGPMEPALDGCELEGEVLQEEEETDSEWEEKDSDCAEGMSSTVNPGCSRSL